MRFLLSTRRGGEPPGEAPPKHARALPESCGLLQDGDDALAAGRTDADHAAPAAALVERLGQRGDDPPAGGGERMPGGQRAAVDVELLARDLAERLVAALLLAREHRVLPGLQRRAYLRGEGL